MESSLKEENLDELLNFNKSNFRSKARSGIESNIVFDGITTLTFVIASVLLIIQALLTILYIFQLDEDDVAKEVSSSAQQFTVSIFSNIVVILGGVGLGICIISFYGVLKKISSNFAFQIVFYLTMLTAGVFSALIWYYVKTDLKNYTANDDELAKLELNQIISNNLAVALFGFVVGAIIFHLLKILLDNFEREDPLIGSGIEIIVAALMILTQSVFCIITYFYYGGSYDGVSLFGFKYIFIITYSIISVISVLFIALGVFMLTL